MMNFNYTVQRKEQEYDPPYYLVKDLEGHAVCESDTKHNAELICKLLNKYT